MTERKLVLSGKLDSGIDGLSLTGGKNNTYVGLGAGASASLGGNNTFVGAYSGANATAESSVFLGVRSGRVAQLAKESVFIGYRSGERAERVDSSICIGPYSGQKMKRANNNTILGYQAGAELTSGSRNTIVGSFAAFQQFNGHDNVCIGHRAGYRNQIGANNCYVGTNSGFAAVSGFENVCLGVGSGQFLASGTKNVLCGFLAGNAISNASNCIAIGTRTMEFFTNGDTNTCLGAFTAQKFTGNNNTILGGYTASNASGDYNTVVGSRSMNRRNNWRVDLESSVVVGENVQFDIPITVQSLRYSNAVIETDVNARFGTFEIDMSPTGDLILPYERYFSTGSSDEPLTMYVGIAGEVNNGYYRVTWGHAVSDFTLKPTRYEIYIGPNDETSASVKITHTSEGELLPDNPEVEPGPDEMYVCVSVDGYPAISALFPRPETYPYIDLVVDQTFGNNEAFLNLNFRHACDPNVPEEPREYVQITTYSGYGATPQGELGDMVGVRNLPGARISISSSSVYVSQGYATFTTQVALADPLSPAELDALSFEGFSRLMNHRLMVPGGEIYIDKSKTPYFNGFWTVKDIVNTHSTTGSCTFTIDISALNLAAGQYPVGFDCVAYLSRVYFTRPSDGLQFFRADAAFAALYNTPVNLGYIYMRVSKGHNLVPGQSVYFQYATDARLNKTFAVLETPALEAGEGSDVWLKFDLGLADVPVESLVGPGIVQYASPMERTKFYAKFEGYVLDPPGVESYVAFDTRTNDPENSERAMIVYSARTDVTTIEKVMSGPAGIDGHFHAGLGSQLLMDANIANQILEFTSIGMSRAVYTIGGGRLNTFITMLGVWVIPTTDITFGIDWLSQYKVTCTKTTVNGVDIFDIFSTNTSDVSVQIAQVSHTTVQLFGSIVGETLPIPVADIMALGSPRASVRLTHQFLKRTLDIVLTLTGGTGDNIVTRTTTIQIENVGEALNDGTTIEYFANTYTQLVQNEYFASQIRDSPSFANVVYIGSSHVVTDENDRNNVFITSLGPNRLIRADFETFRVFSNVFKVPRIEVDTLAVEGLTGNVVTASIVVANAVARSLPTIAAAAGAVAHDFNFGSAWHHAGPAGNFTCELTNVPTTQAGRVYEVNLFVSQGASPYMPTALTINGTSQTIKWLSNVAPTGTENAVDVVNFKLLWLAVGAWLVLGRNDMYGV